MSAGFARGFLDFAVARGADRCILLDRSDLTDTHLDDPDARVAMDAYKQMMRAAKTLCDAPALPLEFSANTRFEKLSVVGLVCQSSANMGAALKQLSRFAKLISDVDVGMPGERFQVVPYDKKLWIEDTRPNPNDFPELTEAALSRFICEHAFHFGDIPFVKQVHVTHPKPAHAADYERIMRVPVTFDSTRNAMEIDPSWLTLKTHRPNEYTFGIFSDRAQALLDSLENARTVRGRMERLMIPMLHTGELNMVMVAQMMGLNRQSLYRRLKAENVSFEQVLDTLRHRMAQHYLSGNKLSVHETAYLVGFSEPSAFSRAFKRWTGSSPRRPQ